MDGDGDDIRGSILWFGGACVALEERIGRVAAEAVAPYPPGIPRLVPGELVTEAHVAYLKLDLEAGTFLMSPTDTRLQTLRVVARAADA
jgi:arginine/lysine/ornithine decarboxylase